jgi:DNA-binding XRE family transcriptional regulator
MYHYTESGLRNVWLRDGYRVLETPYGAAVQISNVEGLHQAIADHLLKQPFLSGREFRFLRGELDMTQEQLGVYLGVSAQRVGQIEKSRRVLRKADVWIRALYRNLPALEITTVLDDVAPERFVQHFHITRAENWLGRMTA